MSIVTCPGCKKSVFTIEAWSDVDRCPNCGRELSAPDAFTSRVREEMQREARRFKISETGDHEKPTPAEANHARK